MTASAQRHFVLQNSEDDLSELNCFLPQYPRIILCTPIPVKSHKLVIDTTLVHDLIPRLLKVARKNKVEVLDLHTLYNDMNTYVADGLHPDARSAKIIATHVANAILAPVKGNATKK